MLYKDIISKSVTTEWAVLTRNTRPNKDAISGKRVARRYANKVTLAKVTPMLASGYIETTADHHSFVPAPKDDRTKRFLVTDGTYFWVVPAGHFIAEYSEMETLWQAEEAEAFAVAHAEQAKNDSRNQVIRQLEASGVDIRSSLKEAIAELLGQSVCDRTSISLSVDGQWDSQNKYHGHLEGEVRVPFRDFQRLLEKVFEAQDNA